MVSICRDTETVGSSYTLGLSSTCTLSSPCDMPRECTTMLAASKYHDFSICTMYQIGLVVCSIQGSLVSMLHASRNLGFNAKGVPSTSKEAPVHVCNLKSPGSYTHTPPCIPLHFFAEPTNHTWLCRSATCLNLLSILQMIVLATTYRPAE